MKKLYLPVTGKRPIYKSLVCLLVAWLTTAVSFAQSPQWVLKQNTTNPVLFNYFNSSNEQGDDPYFVNRLSPTFSTSASSPISFGDIYGSYQYRHEGATDILDFPVGATSFDSEFPLFIIASELATSNPIKVWNTNRQKRTGYTIPFAYKNPAVNGGNPVTNASLFNATGRPTLLTGEKPEFTIIPRVGFDDEYLAFTYIKTGTNTGDLIYYVIETSSTSSVDTFYGPFYLKDNSLQNVTNLPSAKGTIAIMRPTTKLQQNLYLALEGVGIYKFTINHFDPIISGSRDRVLTTLAASYPTPIINISLVPGATFGTSELEISNDRNFIAWADNTTTGINPTVYTINLNAPMTVKQFPITGLNYLQINGLEFNPNYAPSGSPAVNTQLYVTAGRNGVSSGTDGLLKIDVPSSGSATVTSLDLAGSNNRACAQTQLELDYNRNLAMITGNTSFQLQNYVPASATQPNGLWAGRKQLTTFTLSGFADFHRLPRQIDGWDYKFTGSIKGTKQPVVGDGGCIYPALPIQRTITYSAPAINTSTVESVEYEWQLWRGNYGTGKVVTGTGPTFMFPFPDTANIQYTLLLSTNIAERINNYSFDYEYGYYTRMTITTTNGCTPGGSRMALGSLSNSETLIYPNPVADNKLTIKLPANYNQAALEIFDLQGRLIKKSVQSQNEENLNVSDLSNGVYFLNVTTTEYSKKEKIVIAK